MGAGKIGGGIGQISDMRYRGPEEFPGFIDDMRDKSRDITGEMPSPPGYQQPPGEQPPQFDQQGPTQYYQQMRESMSGMDKALKELEGMQMPGGQYQRPDYGYNPGGGKGGKGISLF